MDNDDTLINATEANLITPSPVPTGKPKRTRNNARPEQLRALFADLWGDPRNLLQVYDRLSTYRGPVDPVPFRKWANRIIKKHNRRDTWLRQTLSEHRPVMLRAASIALSSSFTEDCSVNAEDVCAEVEFYLWKNAHKFMKFTQHTRPKLSTRLVGLVKKHAWLYHLKPRWTRRTAVEEQVFAGLPLGVEEFSAEELAEAERLEAEAEYFSRF